jgi:hypothetical protein
MSDPSSTGTGRRWRLAKIGCSLMFLGLVVTITGTFIAMKYGDKFNPLNRPSGILVFVGTGLVVWNVYRVIFPKR